MAIGLTLALAAALAAPAHAQDQPVTLEVAEVYRVGGVNAEEWAFFGPALQPSFDGAGNLLVLDVLNRRIIVIGPAGQLVRVVGRWGEGPGEFQLIVVFAVWRDGRFAVPDIGHSAIQVFSADGELERFVNFAGEGAPMSGPLGYREQLRTDPLSDKLIAQGAGGVLVAMIDRANRRMGHPGNATPAGVDGEPGMPEAFGPDGLVVYVERDELDVPTMVVRRVVLGGR